MRISQADLWDITATRMSSGALTWMNAKIRDAEDAGRPPWNDWAAFRHDVLAQFEPLSKEERAREQIRALTQTGSVHVYVYRFTELRSDIPSMNIAEAFSLFMKGLQPNLKQLVGSMVRTDDLDGAIDFAKQATKYSTFEKTEKDNKTAKDQKFQKGKKGQVNLVQDEDKMSKEQHELMAVQKNRLKQLKDTADKQAQKNSDWKKESDRRRQQQNVPRTCLYCGKKGHFVQQCPKIKELESLKAGQSSGQSSGN